ncbi:MAG: hypothetical protein GY738_29970, partial [Pseudoalteromonas sp.]|nr:hypothetical protein [Pseudoalteromonas sp.]
KEGTESEIAGAGKHPVETHELTENWKKSDHLQLASTIGASDATALLEFYKLENWCYNRTTLNPQATRYKYFMPPSISTVEIVTLHPERIRPPFDLDAHKKQFRSTHMRRGVLTETPGKKWKSKEVEYYYSSQISPPYREAKELDKTKQFQDLVVNRVLTENIFTVGPNYNMTAEVMSPYLPPVLFQRTQIIAYDHTSLLMLTLTLHFDAPM